MDSNLVFLGSKTKKLLGPKNEEEEQEEERKDKNVKSNGISTCIIQK